VEGNYRLSSFKDHFSGHAAVYAQARPKYPAALFDWLTTQTRQHDLAWDAGCGNGQASVALADYFDSVFASDPSATQITAATKHPKVRYAVEPAEQCSLPDRSADLVTVAQALHWFDHPRFYAEVRRVLKPGGVIAAWTYERSSVNADVDEVFARLYVGVLDAYWLPERRHVEAGYTTLPFPFDERPAPAMELRCDWTLAQYLAYLSSWSASQRYLQATGRDAVAEFTPALAQAWGDADTVRAVRWPMAFRIGQV
jgi:ubiquinone/menaquinone biosynthesis C-methylase UbiE